MVWVVQGEKGKNKPPLTLILSPDGREYNKLPRPFGERVGVRGMYILS